MVKATLKKAGWKTTPVFAWRNPVTRAVRSLSDAWVEHIAGEDKKE